MSNDKNKELIAFINAQLSEKYGRGNFRWVGRDDLDYLYIANGVVHGVELKNLHITGSQVVHVIDADHAASVQDMFDRGLIKGDVSVMYLDPPHHDESKMPPESCAEVAAYKEALARQLAMPPGIWMSRIARGVFFFSPRTVERVFEEIIADYRHEMFEAEWRGRTADLRWLRIQYWGAFIKSVIAELAVGSLGRLIRALTGG